MLKSIAKEELNECLTDAVTVAEAILDEGKINKIMELTKEIRAVCNQPKEIALKELMQMGMNLGKANQTYHLYQQK